MGQVIRISDFREPQGAEPDRAPAAEPKPAYYCMRCDTDRFMLYPSGVVRCANCGAVMRNIKVSDSNRKKHGREQ